MALLLSLTKAKLGQRFVCQIHIERNIAFYYAFMAIITEASVSKMLGFAGFEKFILTYVLLILYIKINLRDLCLK